ncbi:MAG: hypothetical protein O3B84_04045, partial [Chloroflexi bacterium]|nr:hypothetical protein [Chloroflexota bacterium]
MSRVPSSRGGADRDVLSDVPGSDSHTPPARNAARSGGNPFRAFRNTNYTFFWIASLLSIISFFMLIIARGWLVFQ